MSAGGGKPMEVAGQYTILHTLGEGSVGKVKLGKHRHTGQKVALKIIALESLKSSKALKRVQLEISILRLLKHPFVTELLDCFQTDDNLFICLEYMEGGDLYQHLQHNASGLPIADTFRIFYQLVSGVEYCHSCCIFHRDIKPENILLDANKTTIKLTDFGMANLCNRQDALLETACGSPHYAAPEVIQCQKYRGSRSDVWSLGVLLFALACGHLPFNDSSLSGVMEKVTAGKFTMPSQFDAHLQDFITGMLQVDTKKRFNIADIKRHPWWRKHCQLYGFDPQGVYTAESALRSGVAKPEQLPPAEPSLAERAKDFAHIPVAELLRHPLITCDSSAMDDDAIALKFPELQGVISAIATSLMQKDPKTSLLHPEEMQQPISEPYDWDAINYIASQQGLTSNPELVANLTSTKPSTEKALYRLLVQQKAAMGSLDHLTSLCPVGPTDSSSPPQSPSGLKPGEVPKDTKAKKSGIKGMLTKVFGGKKEKEKEDEGGDAPAEGDPA
eukprot:GGOE01023585.1.p1 GENE.GGOE01023585.1~~GGOE01023585.1.p1  ORF type:complete len:512 (-),score=173.18 GGOE01023585.1:331-1836(-)